MIAPKECLNADTMCRLWAHETMRVFHDRLISEQDKLWFTRCIVDLFGRHLSRSGGVWSHEEVR